jgi:hypothetical protein
LTVTDNDGGTGSFGRIIVVQPGPGGTFGDFTEVLHSILCSLLHRMKTSGL